MELKEFTQTQAGTIQIDWKQVETTLGFSLHENVKDFYSRALGRYVRGEIKFKEANYLHETGNATFDKWFSKNKSEGKIEIRIDLIKSAELAAEGIDKALKNWMGGKDFGQRFLIGILYMKIGSVLILLNNETGNVEWMDCEYGYFPKYEDNPNGILANSIGEFLGKLAATAV